MKESDLILFLIFLFFSCEKEDIGNEHFVDFRDGTMYRFVTIGNQVWMAEDLKYLPIVTGPDNGSRTIPYYYVYDYSGIDVRVAKTTNNYKTYGVLYNWSAALTACPAGWHLPRNSEWIELVDYLGGIEIAGNKLKEKGDLHWKRLPKTEANNDSEFTALPCGNRINSGEFKYLGDYVLWWSTKEGYEVSDEGEIFPGWGLSVDSWGGRVYNFYHDKEIGASVRCLRD